MKNLTDVAKAVLERWNDIVAGEYKAPSKPSESVLSTLLESVNYAAGFPEEGRYPRFNVTAASSEEHVDSLMRFERARPFTVAELRRLIPATDPKKSAVHVEWDQSGKLAIVGIHDLGTSWHRARVGLEYWYASPTTLLVEVERPNRLSVYQQQYRMASFSDGEADLYARVEWSTFLHGVARGGLEDLDAKIIPPEHEPVSEYASFEFMAFWNCFAAIANSIGMSGHGGAVMIVPSVEDVNTPLLRRKYMTKDTTLSKAFVEFISARHEVGDLYYRRDTGENVDDDTLARFDWKLKLAFDALVERTRLVAQLAQCDGALVLSRSLDVLGFGCEIAAELKPDIPVGEVTNELEPDFRELDVEQFGMRHRSAIKFLTHQREAVVLVVSQDGPISAVWGDADRVYIRKGVRLVNLNLPWA